MSKFLSLGFKAYFSLKSHLALLFAPARTPHLPEKPRYSSAWMSAFLPTNLIHLEIYNILHIEAYPDPPITTNEFFPCPTWNPGTDTPITVYILQSTLIIFCLLHH